MRIPDIFRFTRMERRGVFALIVLCGAYLVAKPFIFSSDGKFPDIEFTALPPNSGEEEQGEAEYKKHLKPQVSTQASKKRSSRYSSLGRNFDPDTLTVADWMETGLSEKQAGALVKYGTKMGGFDDEESFRSSFVVSDEFYAAIATDIKYGVDVSKPQLISEEVETIRSRFDLNTASAEELMSIRGIGPKLSDRIIKFRNVLGGFYSIEQLGEVYGLEPGVIEDLVSRCDLTLAPKKININSVTEEELYKHPYFRNGISGAIVREREKHGKFEKVEDIRRVYLIDEEVYSRILPYITTRDE